MSGPLEFVHPTGYVFIAWKGDHPLGTSAAQLNRLLDQTNYRKSVDQLLALLQVLNCDVDLVVRTRPPDEELVPLRGRSRQRLA